MNKFFQKIIVSIAFVFSISLYADLDESNYSSEIIAPPVDAKAYPFRIKGTADVVGKAKFKKHFLEGQHLNYRNADIEARSVIYYDKTHDEGLGVAASFDITEIDWNENPYFDQDIFHTASLGIGGFTHRFCNWAWRGQAAISVDTDHFNLAEYAFYDLLLWGRYAYNCNVGLNMGILVETGMKIDHILPILGVDWRINYNWKINLVFPVNVSAVYIFDECWTIALAGRVFDSRHRVGKDEPLEKGLVTYTTAGAELALNYDCDTWLLANIHAGYTFGGTLKIANQHYENKRHFKFRPSPYVGAELAVKF